MENTRGNRIGGSYILTIFILYKHEGFSDDYKANLDYQNCRLRK